MERIIKPAFAVIGIEGAVGLDGAQEDSFHTIDRLWYIANTAFDEVEPLAKRGPDGSLAGVWGAMSDLSRAFKPWEEDFSRGLYLAGVEVRDDAQPPEGWVRWDIPGFEYIRLERDNQFCFSRGLALLAQEGLPLAGAVHEFTDPATGTGYLLFPIRKL